MASENTLKMFSTQSLKTKSKNWHSLKMGAQPSHIAFMPHHIDLS